MTITFPRPILTRGIVRARFLPAALEATAPERGGRGAGVRIAQPRWRAEYTLGPMGERLAGEWSAWIGSLRGPGRMFLGRNISRPYPFLYRSGFADLTRHGGGAFNGVATTWDIDGLRDGLSLTGLPSTFELIPGDWIGFVWDTYKRELRKVSEGGVAVDGELTVTLDSPLPAFVPVDAVCTLDRPSCLMRLTPGTHVEESDMRTGTASFSAMQDYEE